MKNLQTRKVPRRITFDTNPDDCNLHCIMCEQHSEFSSSQKERRSRNLPPRRMPINLIKSILEQIGDKGLKEIIPSTMGEPLLYKDFDKILEYCDEYDVKLNLTTNGTFPRRTPADWAERIVPVTSDVKISWNGATATTHETIMKGTNYAQGLQNIRAFIEIRDKIAKAGGNYCRVTLQITFLEENISEIPELIRLASKLGIDRIKGHHLWVHFPEIEDLSLRRNPESMKKWNHVATLAYEAIEKYRLASGHKIQLENFFPLNPHFSSVTPSGVCPFLGQEAWVSAEGRFDPCCAPDVQRRTLGDFGNLFETDFLSIWQSNEYQQLVRNYLSFPLCQTCLMRKPNRDDVV